ncbi:hypothetical protein A2U01_0112567, partial [Trifolium medium]|nr:hypothetical protein [Trifolium medium]
PVPVVAGVELSAVAEHASFPYDVSQLAPAVLDIDDVLLAVVATSEPTYYLLDLTDLLRAPDIIFQLS